MRSTDNGATWNNVTSPFGDPDTNCTAVYNCSVYLEDVTFGNNTFVAVGYHGMIARSTDDGSSFDNGTLLDWYSSNHILGVTFGNNTFVGVGYGGSIWRSTDDGTTFDMVTSPATDILWGVTFY